jgi:hypothetical protein
LVFKNNWLYNEASGRIKNKKKKLTDTEFYWLAFLGSGFLKKLIGRFSFGKMDVGFGFSTLLDIFY